MKKHFFILACVLVVAAIGFVIYAAGHPELSFPWSIQITHILYGLYADAVVLLFVLAFWKKTDSAYIPVVLLELGAVFFLVQSMLTVFPDGESNWYLPLALGLNGIALLWNAAWRRKQKREEERMSNRESKISLARQLREIRFAANILSFAFHLSLTDRRNLF